MKKCEPNYGHNNGLDVIIECYDMKTVNYLNDIFNLDDGTYQTYQNPNKIMQYKFNYMFK